MLRGSCASHVQSDSKLASLRLHAASFFLAYAWNRAGNTLFSIFSLGRARHCVGNKMLIMTHCSVGGRSLGRRRNSRAVGISDTSGIPESSRDGFWNHGHRKYEGRLARHIQPDFCHDLGKRGVIGMTLPSQNARHWLVSPGREDHARGPNDNHAGTVISFCRLHTVPPSIRCLLPLEQVVFLTVADEARSVDSDPTTLGRRASRRRGLLTPGRSRLLRARAFL